MTGISDLQILLLLPSIHDVLAVEDRARAAGLWVDVLPKPTVVATDCGMVLGCRAADLDVFRGLICEVGARVLATWRVVPGGFARIDPEAGA